MYGFDKVGLPWFGLAMVNGNGLNAGRSIEYAEVPPPPKGDAVLRGQILTSGWVIRRNKNNPSTCVVTYLTQVDLAGIPAAVQNIVATRQPLNVAGRCFVRLACGDVGSEQEN